MNFTLWRTKRERNLLILTLSISAIVVGYALFNEKDTRREDIDGDGIEEIVNEIQLPDGRRIRTVIEEDGTMYQTDYNHRGEEIHRWMMVPLGGSEYITYVWDKETEQWLPDQNQDGIPDNQIG